MGPPPSKRQKKLVVLSSEDEDLTSPRRKPAPKATAKRQSSNDLRVLPNRSRSKAQPPTTLIQSPSSEPVPLPPPKRSISKQPTIRKDSGTSSLRNYFGELNQSGLAKDSARETPKDSVAHHDEDFIEDDSFDEGLRSLSDPRQKLHQDGGNQSVSSEGPAGKGKTSKLPLGSQIFRGMKNNAAQPDNKQATLLVEEHDTRPWAERYGPNSIEELAVHKKKVADVREWLHNALQGNSGKRVLVLRGPAGVGKTSTISFLAQAMGFDVLEWANPTVADLSSDNYLSTSALFDDFLRRGGKFSSLEVGDSEDRDGPVIRPLPVQDAAAAPKKIILVEELPNTFSSSSTAVQTFRSVILRYLASPLPSNTPLTSSTIDHRVSAMPLVMVITETQVSNNISFGDSLTAHRLLGADILNHRNADVIEFNPVAPTFINKALTLVLQKATKHYGPLMVPSPPALKRLGDFGDIRSAIGSLEFLYLKGHDRRAKNKSPTGKSKRRSKAATFSTNIEEPSIELISQRESSLGLFHAVGKVVYNKREGPTAKDETSIMEPATQQLRSHLPQHVRLKTPDVAVDSLIDETGTDAQTFVAALHENYVPSCNGQDFLDTLNSCIEFLSDSDILVSDHAGRSRGTASNFRGSTSSDSVKQEEIAFHVAVRGLLFSLPCPVVRAVVPSGTTTTTAAAGRKGGKADAYKMFYPASIRLRHQIPEIDELVERWIRRRRVGVSADDAAAGTATGVGEQEEEDDQVTSWIQRMGFQDRGEIQEEEEDYSSAAAGGARACQIPEKEAVVTDVLPYLTVIERSRPSSTGSRLLEELERITRVNGEALSVVAEEREEDGDDMAMKKESGEEVKMSQRYESRKQAGNVKTAPAAPAAAADGEAVVKHLYLSDDDIED
ncbi:MAG: hypothetical protein Q9220_003265 [cf. Caloplaca sp. 1 TL-2023]